MVLGAWRSVGYRRKLRSLIQARRRRVLRPSLTRFDPVWPFEVTEIIEITPPPGDLFIRRLKVRILHGPPSKSRGYGESRSPYFVRLCSKCAVGPTIEGAIKDSEGCCLVGGGKVGIAKGHLEVLVSEQFLDRGQIHSTHDKMGREGMPQIVEVKILDTHPA